MECSCGWSLRSWRGAAFSCGNKWCCVSSWELSAGPCWSSCPSWFVGSACTLSTLDVLVFQSLGKSSRRLNRQGLSTCERRTWDQRHCRHAWTSYPTPCPQCYSEASSDWRESRCWSWLPALRGSTGTRGFRARLCWVHLIPLISHHPSFRHQLHLTDSATATVSPQRSSAWAAWCLHRRESSFGWMHPWLSYSSPCKHFPCYW